jgi:hypothetical protein
LKSHLKCFSLEKHIGVRRKEVTLNHATSDEILQFQLFMVAF